tara:strand:- start:586 stop:1476 length:891 start_codon:yes stop_codon:yes gene_type:complete
MIATHLRTMVFEDMPDYIEDYIVHIFDQYVDLPDVQRELKQHERFSKPIRDFELTHSAIFQREIEVAQYKVKIDKFLRRFYMECAISPDYLTNWNYKNGFNWNRCSNEVVSVDGSNVVILNDEEAYYDACALVVKYAKKGGKCPNCKGTGGGRDAMHYSSIGYDKEGICNGYCGRECGRAGKLGCPTCMLKDAMYTWSLCARYMGVSKDVRGIITKHLIRSVFDIDWVSSMNFSKNNDTTSGCVVPETQRMITRRAYIPITSAIYTKLPVFDRYTGWWCYRIGKYFEERVCPEERW